MYCTRGLAGVELTILIEVNFFKHQIELSEQGEERRQAKVDRTAPTQGRKNTPLQCKESVVYEGEREWT
ncbi:MAG: hypothetical protein K8R16_00990 [Anaerolineales bacterium]|nr:hypothetical protein [Anaerolineales bacterium]